MEHANCPVALIVGGSSGIGLAIAKLLLERNIHTVIVGNSQNKLEAATRECSAPGTLEVLQANLYTPNDVQRIVTFAKTPADTSSIW